MANQVSCKKFTDYLIRRAEHFDSMIVRDITPTDGWVGHVSTGIFPPGDGITRQFDKLHRVYPDMSAAWEDAQAGNCLTGHYPCDPTETEIGMGYTQEEYVLQQKSYKTQLFCFDQIMSADRAKEQFDNLIMGLRMATNIIMSDRLRTEAWRIAKYHYVPWEAGGGGQGPSAITYTSTGNLITMTPSLLPTGCMNIEVLQRFVQQQILEGSLGSNPDMPPILEYVTDIETAWFLREGNSALQNQFRFTDFVKGGALYKYGITDAIGNFGIRVDPFPMRFLEDGGTLYRVFPYTNVTATGGYGGSGIKGDVNSYYLDAGYQIDFIWNRYAMKSLIRKPMQINPMMPFAQRDFGGKWQFVMDNLGADAQGCVIENKRRNKGMFISDFHLATKDERPEWAIGFLTLRNRSCVAQTAQCFTPATYSAQDYNSANDPCEFVVEFTLTDDVGDYALAAGAATCNGVNIAHPAASGLADRDAVLVWLNTNLGELGVFTAGAGANDVVLTGQVCESFAAPFTSA